MSATEIFASRGRILEIDAEGARFYPADRLWGTDTHEAQNLLQLSRQDGALAIGPAGEHRVLFANIASGRRFLGRGGMGAVMGAKRLKAVVARGRKAAVAVEEPRAFEKARKKASAYIQANDFTGRVYRSFGTAANVTLCNQGGILPVRNFTDGRHPDAGAVSGETMREKYRARPSTCKPCSILCGHKGTYSDGDHQIPEYETVGMLGPNLGIFDFADFLMVLEAAWQGKPLDRSRIRKGWGYLICGIKLLEHTISVTFLSPMKTHRGGAEGTEKSLLNSSLQASSVTSAPRR